MRVRTSRASVISIHAPRTGSDEGGRRFIRGQGISIHAPRTGSDKANGHSQFKQSISIHAPRTGSDVVGHAQKVFALAFQSTLPARGATGVPKCMMYRYAFQSTLPARGATWTTLSISPRRRFQSTLPARGATPQDIKTKNIKADFNPRSPHGERQNGFCTISAKPRISIHAPRTGSDPPFDYNRINAYISIHAPRTGSDCSRCRFSARYWHFNPRSPHGERRVPPASGVRWAAISIHAPRTGSDKTYVCD